MSNSEIAAQSAETFAVEVDFCEDGSVQRLSIVEPKEMETSTYEKSLVDELLWLSIEWQRTCLGFFEAAPAMSFATQALNDATVSNLALKHVEGCNVGVADAKDGSKVFEVPSRERLILSRNIDEANRFRQISTVHRNALLLALIAEYEIHFRKLVTILFRSNPLQFVGNDTEVKTLDVFKATDLKQLQETIFAAKVDKFLSGSHYDKLKSLGARVDKNFLSDAKLTAEFVEICERRNLFAHNGGVVNAGYLDKCEAVEFKWTEKPSVGDLLSIDDHYLQRAFARFFMFGFFPLHMIIQKNYPSEIERSIDYCNSCSHDFLSAGLTKMARRVADFGLSSARSKGNQKQKIYLTINKALSYFLDDNLEKGDQREKVNKELKSLDWSVTDSTTKLALNCIKENYEEIDTLVQNALSEDVGYYEFSTWALFEKARKVDCFKDAVSKHLGLKFME
jgi:hypothetical protein